VSIVAALQSSSLQWGRVRGRRPGWELRSGRDVLALATDADVRVDDRPYRLEAGRGGRTTLVTAHRGDRIATVRELSSGPAVMQVGSGRYRLMRRGVLPFRWQVTRDIGGPAILTLSRFRSMVRVSAGPDAADAPDAELDLLVVLSGMRLLGLLDEPASRSRRSPLSSGGAAVTATHRVRA
jgi:hypothetical protein